MEKLMDDTPSLEIKEVNNTSKEEINLINDGPTSDETLPQDRFESKDFPEVKGDQGEGSNTNSTNIEKLREDAIDEKGIANTSVDPTTSDGLPVGDYSWVADDNDNTEVIDLRPDSSSSSDEYFPTSHEFQFKKRKTSHSRRYRKKKPAEGVVEEEDPPPLTDSDAPPLNEEPPPLTDSDAPPSSDDEIEGPTPRRPSIGSEEGSDGLPALQAASDISSDTDIEDLDDLPRSRIRARRIVRAGHPVSAVGDTTNDYNDNNSSTTDEDEIPALDSTISDKTKEVVFKPLSTPRFNLCRDLASRQLGLSLRPTFTARQCASAELVKRLKLAFKLKGHAGCVNSLHFNMAGDKIASGSDDLNIIVWEWQRQKKLVSFNTGHKANVFQSKFMPGDLLITSCSRDGQVRLAELSVTGSLRSTRKLAQHKGPAHKMSLLPNCPYIVLSAGEDGQVFSVDIREAKPDKILLLRNEKDKKIPIYSIHSNPSNGNMFCTAGRDQFVRLFDRRYLDLENRREVAKFCPSHLRDNSADISFKAYITCAVFSEDGSQVIGSYNDEDIYMFNTHQAEEGADFIHRYQGHRNSATVKGVNFYGPNSEYVISGSDCGNIFIWDKETEGLVKLMAGDENGVVNVLEPHPSMPILATSGLDDEVKVWLPNQVTSGPGHCWQREQKEYMQKTVQRDFL